jgi:hypothetical protein
MVRGMNSRLFATRRTHWRHVCVCLAFAIVSGGGVARAHKVLAADIKPDAKEDPKYHDTLRDALAEYDAHHFEEARILFRRAHDLNPNARTLRSIGMASFELRDYVAAVRALSASLVDARKPLNPEQRAHVQGLLERSRMFVSVYTLKISPADAQVLIDGRAPEFEADGTLLLGFGAHNLEVRKTGFMLRTFSVNVRGGERKELAMTLERKPADQVQGTRVAQAAEVAESTRANAKAVTPPRAGWHPGSGWLLAAGGTALVALGGGAWWLDRNNELNKCSDPPVGYSSPCYQKNTIQTQRNLALGATLAAGAAAVTMAVVGIVSWNLTPHAPANHGAIACSVFPAGLVCGRTF